MLTEQTVLLTGPEGGRAGVRYAAGVGLTTVVIVVAVVLFGHALSLPTEPHLDATLDLVPRPGLGQRGRSRSPRPGTAPGRVAESRGR